MIYLHRYTTDAHGDQIVDIAACEDARNVAWYEARGFTRCTLEAFRQAWRDRDMARLAELDAERVLELPQPSAVGSDAAPHAPASEMTRPPVTTSMHGWGA